MWPMELVLYIQLQIILSLPNKLREAFHQPQATHNFLWVPFLCDFIWYENRAGGGPTVYVCEVKRTKEGSSTIKVLVLCELQGTVPNE